MDRLLSMSAFLLLVSCGKAQIDFGGPSIQSKPNHVKAVDEQAPIPKAGEQVVKSPIAASQVTLVKQTDLSNVSTALSQAIIAPTAAPGGASVGPVALPPPIAKFSGVPEGISSVTKLNIQVNGLGVSAYKYTIAFAGKACDTSKFSNAISINENIADDLAALPNGTITVCTKAISENGTEQSVPSKVSFVKDTSSGIASISGAPSGFSNLKALDVLVSGNGVIEYVYGFGIDCASVSYSPAKKIASAPKIQDSIADAPDGPMKLCVKGISKDVATQQLKTQSNATFVTWVKDTEIPVAKILGAPEGDSSADSVTVAIADAYQYKFAVEQGATCKESNFSVWRSGPLNIDVSKLPLGSISVCAIAIDAAGNLQDKATVHTWNRVAPGGVTLTGAPVGESDLVELKVTVKTSSKKYKYAVLEGSTCQGASLNTERASTLAIEDNIKGLKDGPIVVCAQTKAENESVYTAQATWTKATEPKPPVEVKGVPVGESNAMGLSALVISKHAMGYRYVLGTSEADCKPENATTQYDINEFISESLIEYPMGPMNLCVWGVDNGGKLFGPTVKKWTKQFARCEGGIASGTEVTRVRNKADAVPWDAQCEPEEQKAVCDNGYLSWSGSYVFETCKVTTPESCKVGDVTVPHQTEREFFSTAVDVDCDSKKQKRSCVNGTLSGDTSFNKGNCDIPRCDGKPYDHVEERTFYESASPAGACNSQKQTRQCQKDQTWTKWTGTFTHSSCNAGCGKLTHGKSQIFYLQSSSYGCYESQYRTCNNGTLSGSYQHENCANVQICVPGSYMGCQNPNAVYCNSIGSGYDYYPAEACGYVPKICTPWGFVGCNYSNNATQYCNGDGTQIYEQFVEGSCNYTVAPPPPPPPPPPSVCNVWDVGCCQPGEQKCDPSGQEKYLCHSWNGINIWITQGPWSCW